MLQFTQQEWAKNQYKDFYSRGAWEFRGRDYPEKWIGRRNTFEPGSTNLIAEGVHFLIVGENEFEREQLKLRHDDVEIDYEDDNTILASFECWFDVDKKFGISIIDLDGVWVNLYAKLNVPENKLTMMYIISSDIKEECFDYIPTTKERELIIDIIKDFCMKEYNQTVEEFIQSCK